MLPTPEIDDAARATIAAAREVVGMLCDDLRPRLVGLAGQAAPRTKSDGTPVTDADVETDRQIRRALRDAFPDHALISEEDASVWDGREWAWVVDPIDGTSNFIAGIPYWSISIALTRFGLPVYGCVEAPPLGTRFEATSGAGATRDGRPIHVREPVDFRDGRNAHVPVAVTAGTIRRADPRVRLNARILGSTALDLAMVAAGHLVAAYQRVPKIWDIAAGALLVEEAGGAYVSLDGRPALLPMPADTELGEVDAPGIAGPSPAWLTDLADTMIADEGA